MNLNSLILLDAQPASGMQGGGTQMIVFLVLIIVVFYFFMIRPQQKKQKKMQDFRAALKKGDKIITIGGIHGKIVEVEETTFTIEVEGGVKLKVDKAAIAIDENQMKAAEKEKK